MTLRIAKNSQTNNKETKIIDDRFNSKKSPTDKIKEFTIAKKNKYCQTSISDKKMKLIKKIEEKWNYWSIFGFPESVGPKKII